jgi:hypothetical protein
MFVVCQHVVLGGTSLKIQGVKFYYRYKPEELEEVMSSFQEKLQTLEANLTKVSSVL